ncbi:hypothetical protein [Clostridium thermarum]|nr:hypothetical protein [Clostridium thermarum]
MKIIIMTYTDKNAWYKNKVGKVYTATKTGTGYKTKDGEIYEKDAEVIEK